MLTTAYLAAWARAFVFTQLVEMPITHWGFGARWRMAFAASLLTHPFVWFAFPWLGIRFGVPYAGWVALAEVFALLAEAALFARVERFGARRGFVTSLVANGASYALGVLADVLFGGI